MVRYGVAAAYEVVVQFYPNFAKIARFYKDVYHEH
jgi:hypothetical protein